MLAIVDGQIAKLKRPQSLGKRWFPVSHKEHWYHTDNNGNICIMQKVVVWMGKKTVL